MPDSVVTVVGGGLAGCEAAWQAARRGGAVHLFEMRPRSKTGAHQTDWLAELVCSNSLKSETLEDASGLLKAEMRALGSLMLTCAEAHRVPAGSPGEDSGCLRAFGPLLRDQADRHDL